MGIFSSKRALSSVACNNIIIGLTKQIVATDAFFENYSKNYYNYISYNTELLCDGKNVFFFSDHTNNFISEILILMVL